MSRRMVVSLAAVIAIGACTDQQEPSPTDPAEAPSLAPAKKSKRYVVSITENSSVDVAGQIQRAGGRLRKVSKEAGVVTVESDAADFATKVRAIQGVEGVGLDRVIRWVDPDLRLRDAGQATASSGRRGGSIGDDETLFNLQWAPKAIDAPKAWNKGARGKRVRVAVLDGGLNNNHIDLAGSVDVACSASMVEGFNFNQDVPGFSHSTHVSGIVAARDNSIGTIGVAPGATIMGVKVLQGGSGSFEDVIDGILYAAKPSNTPGKQNCKRADIINMSLGATFIPLPEDRELLRALDKATKFANKQGVTIIAAAGNAATDHDRGSVVTVPAESKHVIAVSATGPVGFALGAKNFKRPASYTNFGKSLVDFSAPGGDFVLPGEALCTVPPATNLCWVFDMMISPGTLTGNGYYFSAGTSMAAPMVAGVAALIIEENGGRMKPEKVEAALRRSADRLSPRKFHGNGFVNALRAVQGGGDDDDDDDGDDD